MKNKLKNKLNMKTQLNSFETFETETDLKDYEQYLNLKSLELFSNIGSLVNNKNIKCLDNIVTRNRIGNIKKKDVKSFIEDLNYMIEKNIVTKALSKPFYLDVSLTGNTVLSCLLESKLSTNQLNKEYDKYLKIKQIKK